MVDVTAEGALRDLLSSLTEEAVIRDGDGNVLGYFTPRAQVRARLYEKAKALIDPVEMKRRKEAEHGKGLTIEQVMDRLNGLEAPE